MPFDGSLSECPSKTCIALPSENMGTQRRRLLAITGGFSLAACVLAAPLAKASVFDPVLPHESGPGVIQMPCMCMKLP
jgi:hypothetical protein